MTHQAWPTIMDTVPQLAFFGLFTRGKNVKCSRQQFFCEKQNSQLIFSVGDLVIGGVRIKVGARARVKVRIRVDL